MANYDKEMPVVKNLDVERYMGRWYEIASLPSSFEPKNGENTRATYALNPDGTIHVLNETWIGGKRGSIEGILYKADPKSDEAKLKVKFYVHGEEKVGDYWVLYVDEGYQYALVGEPSAKYLWILCRQTHMDEEVYNQLVQIAINDGYDVLRKTPQAVPPPEAEQGPKDTKGI